MRRHPHLRRLLVGAPLLLLGLFLAIQIIPFGRDHTNPKVVVEPAWDSLTTRALASRACFDCHSNETEWPWYSSLAPMSWFIQRHVEEGREELNFSEWHRAYEEAEEASETLREGSMPPAGYALLQTKARLSSGDRKALVEGLARTLGEGHGGAHGGYDDDDDDD